MAVLDFLKGIFQTKDPAEVTQGDVLASVRQSYPQFADVPDKEIVAKVAARNPSLSFMAQYEPDKPIPPELVPKPLRTPKFYDMNQDIGKADATELVTRFKEKYPVYKDVDNVRLAQALEKKFPDRFPGLGNRLNEPITPPSEKELGTKPLAEEPPAPQASSPDAAPSIGIPDKVNQMIKELPTAPRDPKVETAAMEHVQANPDSIESRMINGIIKAPYVPELGKDAALAGIVELNGVFKGLTGLHSEMHPDTLKALKERKVSPEIADMAGQIVGGGLLMAGVGAVAGVQGISERIGSMFTRTPEVARYLAPTITGAIEMGGADSIREGLRQVKEGALDLTRFGKVILHGTGIGAGGGMFGGFTSGAARIAGSAAFGAATAPSDDPKEVAINAGIWGIFAAHTAKDVTESQKLGAYRTAKENIKSSVEAEAAARGYTPEDSGKIVGATLDAFDGTIDKFGGIKNVKVRDFEKASRDISGEMEAAFNKFKPYVEAPKQIPTGGSPPPQASPDGFGPSGEAPPSIPAKEVPPEPPARTNRTPVTPEQFDRYFEPMNVPGEAEHVAALKQNMGKVMDAYHAALKEQDLPPNVVSGDVFKAIDIPGWGKLNEENTMARQRIGSSLAGATLENELKDPANAGKPVRIMAGISGAGKTTALKGIENPEDYAALFDTNLPNVKNAKRIVDKILASDPDRKIIITYVNRDPIEAFKTGVYPRAKTEGRIVTVNAHVGYMKTFDTVAELQKVFEGNDRVQFRFIESAGGKQATVGSIDKLKKPDYNDDEARRNLNEFIQNEYDSGKLSEHAAQAYVGRNLRTVRNPNDRGNGPGSEPNLGSQSQEQASLTPQDVTPPKPSPENQAGGFSISSNAPDIDRGLYAALHTYESAKTRWDSLRQKGATDAEIKKAIGYEFGSFGGATDPVMQDHSGGSNPKFWLGGRSKGSPLQGKALVSKVRELLKIPSPSSIEENVKSPRSSGGNSESLGARGSEIIDNFEKVPAIVSDQPNEKELKLFDRYRAIAQEFTTRIGERYVTSKNEGEFFPKSGTVRVRALNNASVLIHEISHAIDAKEKIVDKVLRDVGQRKDGKPVYDPAFAKLRDELTKIYVEYYPTGKKDHPLRKRMTEGYATFIQKFHEQPTMIAGKFPTAYRDILAKDGPLYSQTINDLIMKMNAVTREYQKQDALHKVGSRVTSKNAQDEIKDSYLNFWEKFYTQTIDEVYPIEMLAGKTGRDRTIDDPSLWLRQYNNVNHIIFNNFTGKDGFWVLKGDEFVKTSEKNIKNLLDRLQKRGLVDDFGYYLVSRDQHFAFLELDKLRGPALEAAKFLKELEEKKTELAGGFILDAALKKDILEAKKNIEAFKRLDKILKNNGFDRAVVTEAYEKNKSMFEAEEQFFDTFTRGNLDILNTAHLIRPKQYEEFTTKQGYAPLKRDVFDEILGAGEGRLPDLKAGNTRVSSMISRKGSQLTILNPLYSLLRDHAEVYRKALKQVVFNKIGDLAPQLPDAFHKLKLVTVVDKNTGKITYPQDNDKNIIMARNSDGTRVPYLTGKELKGVIDDLLDFKSIDTAGQLLRSANRIFTKGTTAQYPLFALTNFVVDQISSAANTRNAFIPIYDPLAKVLKATLDHGSPAAKFYQEYLALAGEQQTFAHWQDLSPDKLFSKISGEKDALLIIADFIEKGFDILTIPTAKSEIWTRAAEYVKSRMAENPQVVALEDAGRVSAPFHHLGQWNIPYVPFNKTWVKSVPFMNPGIQAAAQFGRSLFGNKKESQQRAAFVTLAVSAALISALAYLMMRGSKEQKKLYKELEPNELAGYLWLPARDGKSLMKFKIPAEIGIPGTIINMILADYMLNAKYTVKDYVSGATAWMPDQINFTQPIRMILSALPQLIKPAVNVLYGKKDWPAIRPMESRMMESKEPRFRFNENTSKFAKYLGDRANLSPIKIDYLLEGYMGRFVRFFTGKKIPNPFVREWYFTSGRTLEDYFDQKDEINQAIKALKDGSRKVGEDEQKYLLERHGEIKVIDKYLEIYRKLNDEFKAGRIKTNDDLIQLRTQILDRIDTFRAIKPGGKR